MPLKSVTKISRPLKGLSWQGRASKVVFPSQDTSERHVDGSAVLPKVAEQEELLATKDS